MSSLSGSGPRNSDNPTPVDTGIFQESLHMNSSTGNSSLAELHQFIRSFRIDSSFEGYGTKYSSAGKEYLVLYPSEQKPLLNYLSNLLSSSKPKFTPYEFNKVLSMQTRFGEVDPSQRAWVDLESRSASFIEDITKDLNLRELLYQINNEFLTAYSLIGSETSSTSQNRDIDSSMPFLCTADFLSEPMDDQSALLLADKNTLRLRPLVLDTNSLRRDDRAFLISLLTMLRQIVKFCHTCAEYPVIFEAKNRISFHEKLFEQQVEHLNTIIAFFPEDISHFGLIKIMRAFHSAIGSYTSRASYEGMVKSLQNLFKEINETKHLPISLSVKRQVILLQRLLDADVNDKDLVARVASSVLRNQVGVLIQDLKQLLHSANEVFEKKIIKQQIFEELAKRLKYLDFHRTSLSDQKDAYHRSYSRRIHLSNEILCSAKDILASLKSSSTATIVSQVDNYFESEKKFKHIIAEIEKMLHVASNVTTASEGIQATASDYTSEIDQLYSSSMLHNLLEWLEHLPKPKSSYDIVPINTYEKLRTLFDHEKDFSVIGSFRLNISGKKNSVFTYNVEDVINHEECARLWVQQQVLHWINSYDSSSLKWTSFYDGSMKRFTNAEAEILQSAQDKIFQLVKSSNAITTKQIASLIDLHAQSTEPSLSLAAYVLFQRSMHVIIDSIANHGYLTSVASLPSIELQHVYVQLTETAFATLRLLTVSLPLSASAASILESCFVSVIQNTLELCYPPSLSSTTMSRKIPDFVTTGVIAIPKPGDIQYSKIFESLQVLNKIFASAKDQLNYIKFDWLQNVDVEMSDYVMELLRQLQSEVERQFMEQFCSSFAGLTKAFASDDFLTARNIVDAWTALASSPHDNIYARYRDLVQSALAYHRIEKILTNILLNYQTAFNVKDVLIYISQVNAFEDPTILHKDTDVESIFSRDEEIDKLLHMYRSCCYNCHILLPSATHISSILSNFVSPQASNLNRVDLLTSYVLGKSPRVKEYEPYSREFMTSFQHALGKCVEYVKKLASIDITLRGLLKSYHIPVFKLSADFESVSEFVKTAYVLTYPIESSIDPSVEDVKLISDDILMDLDALPLTLNPARDLLEEYSLLPLTAYNSKKDLLMYLKSICDIHDDVSMLAKGLSVDHKGMTTTHLHSAILPAYRSYLHAYSLMSNNYLVKYLESSITRSTVDLMAPALASPSARVALPISNYELKSYISSIFNHLPYEKSAKLLSVYYSLDLIFECRLAQQSKSYIYFDKVLLQQVTELDRVSSNTPEGLIFTKDVADVQNLSKLFHVLSDYMSEKFTLFQPCADKSKGSLRQCSHCIGLKPLNDFGLNTDDPSAMLLQLLSFLRQACDIAALDYLTNFMKRFNGFKLLQDLSASSSPYHRILISYVYASIRTCYRQVMERFSYHQLVNSSISYSPGPSISSNDSILIKDRFPYQPYREYFNNATTLSWRNRACSSKLRHQKLGNRLHISHSLLYAVDVRPGSLRFSKFSTFHSFSRRYLWRWHDEELYREINESIDLSLCKGRIDLSLVFIQSYLNICNLIDKLKAMNVIHEVNEDLYRVAVWTMNVRQLIFMESWKDLEEKLQHYKKNESIYYPGRSTDYVSWMHQGPLKLHQTALAVMLHHHSIYTLDQLITAVNVHEKKSNGLFFKFIDFDLLDDALKSAMRCSLQSDELRQKIAMCKFIHDLNISTSQGYWVDDHSVVINISSQSVPASPSKFDSNASYLSAASDAMNNTMTNESHSYRITPSVASLLRICNDFMMTRLYDSDERNIPISLSVFPTLIQSEIQNIEREFNNQQIEDRLIESIQVGKDYLNDITNLASSIDIQSLEKIVEAASTLRHRSQRNISLYDIAVKVMRLRQAVKLGNWNLIRGLINEMNVEQVVPEVADEIHRLKELAQDNQILHQGIIEAMSNNQIKGTQFQLDIEGVDSTGLLRALSSARYHSAPILSAYDRLMVYSAEKLATLRSCVLMEDYDKLYEEIDVTNLSNISSYCIQEILLIKSSIDLWMNFRQVHDCLRGGGVSGNVGQLNVRCPSLYPLSSALQAVNVISYPDSTKVFLGNARFMEKLRQTVKGGKWNIESVSMTLSQQLRTIIDFEQTHKAKVSRITSSKLSTPTSASIASMNDSHDSRYKLCRIEDAEYCTELFGGQLIKSTRNQTSIPSFYDVSSSEALSIRRYNKDIEYVWKKLLSNVSLSLNEVTSFDAEYWSTVKPAYSDLPCDSMFISKLLIPQDISISNKTGKIMIAQKTRTLNFNEAATPSNDEDSSLINMKCDVSELLLSITCLVADVENEVLLVRDELYHRISMFVLQEGLNRDKILIDDDRLLSSSSSSSSLKAHEKSPSRSLFPKSKTLTKAAFIRPPAISSSFSLASTGQASSDNAGSSESEANHIINLSTAIMIVEHLGIKSPAVLRRYRTALLVRKLREAIDKKKVSNIIHVLQEVKILKNSDCFDSLAINEVDNIFIYISNLNIRKQIYRAFQSFANESLLDFKFHILRILREYNDNVQESNASSSRYGKDPTVNAASTVSFAPGDSASSSYAAAADLSTMPTIHSRHLFRLCEACAEFVDAIGRLASRRVQSSRRYLEQVWNELDHRYYDEEYEDGFKHVKDFILEMFDRYPEIAAEDNRSLDSTTYSLRELTAATVPLDTPKLKVVGRASSEAAGKSHEMTEALDFVRLFEQSIDAIDVSALSDFLVARTF
jgi:hypothetical protein